MQSRCNDTRVSGGYEIVGSLTVRERFVGTWVKRHYSPFELVSIAPCTPLAGKGCVASKLSNVAFELDLLLGLSNWA